MANATTKRQAQLDLLKPLQNLLDKLHKHKFAWVFAEPVDPIKLNIPDYFNIIKKPMDLGTVQKNLRENHYHSHEDFASDVNQIWENAMTYNPPGNDVHEMGKSMKESFAKEYDKFLQKQAQAQSLSVSEKAALYKASVETEEEKPRPKKVPTPMKASPIVSEKKSKREREDGEEPVKKKRKSMKGEEDGKVMKKKPPMKLEDKQQLGINIVKLQHYVIQNKITRDKLHRVVQISREANGEGDIPLKADEEVELDIGTMDNKTLWRLDSFVKNALAQAGIPDNDEYTKKLFDPRAGEKKKLAAENRETSIIYDLYDAGDVKGFKSIAS